MNCTIPIPGIWSTLAESVMVFARSLLGTGSDSQRLSVFRQILSDYDNLISRLCYGYARTTAEFEDLRQDAYANIWSGLAGFRADSSLKTWVYRVTLNTCVSTLRKRSKTVPTISQEIFADVPDTLSEELTQVEALHAAIDKLNPMDKAVVLMWLDSKNYDEIAEVCGLSRNTVAVRLHRAKDKLKNSLKDEL